MKDKITGIELCDGCKYSDHNEWLRAEKDTCGVCVQGSQKQPPTDTPELLEENGQEEPCCDTPSKDKCDQCQEVGLADPKNQS